MRIIKTIWFFLFLAGILSCNRVGRQIPNPSMEKMHDGKLVGWDSSGRRDQSCVHAISNVAHRGKRSLSISADTPSSGMWSARIRLEPFTRYRFTAWIKTEDLVAGDGEGAGLVVPGMVPEPEFFSGTHDWTRIEYELESGWDDSMIARLVFGGRRGGATGKVWLDDLSLEVLSQEKKEPAIRADLGDVSGEPMQEYIYGQFIEHLGRCIYGGIWAEMLEDRKFYYAPGDSMSPWTICGKGTRLEMDIHYPYAGKHTPVIMPGNAGGGLCQEQIGLKKGVACRGRIILRANQDISDIVLKLYWAPGTCDSVVIHDVSSEFKESDFVLHPAETTLDGKLEISARGSGYFSIGTISLMPEDNIEGFRADVLRLLKELDSPVYRWPGGNFVSGYDWRDGIGPVDKRPPRKNPAWTGIEHNDVGIHEFLRFCELLGAEPYIAVNAGLGGSKMAREQVEYANGSADTPMGKLREKNGRKEPWHVKWWSVGNEMYGNWQLGHMPTEEFVRKHNEFVETMKSADSNIVIVAVGNPGRWDEMMLTHCADHMDLISEHFYRQDWHGGGLITHVRQIPDAIRERAELHRRYREEIPGLAEKDIRICMDEWNYWYGPHVYGELGTRYFLKDALGIAAGIHEYSRQSDMIYMANYAQTVNVIGCIKTDDIHAGFAATGLVLKLYRHQFGTRPVAIEETYRPLEAAVTLTEGGDTVCIGIVNPTMKSWKLPLELNGAEAEPEALCWTIGGKDPMAYNVPGMDPVIRIEGPVKARWVSGIEIRPLSIQLLRIPVNQTGLP